MKMFATTFELLGGYDVAAENVKEDVMEIRCVWGNFFLSGSRENQFLM